MGDRIDNLTIDGKRLIKDLKVLELKAELEHRGLSKYGNKKELLQRLSIFEENRQKSLSGQPNCEVPNQWLENEADLNNDFLREYFRSQKALFQEHAQRRTEIGVGEVPSVSSSKEQSQPKDELLSGSDRESFISPIIAPPSPSKKKKRKNKKSPIEDKQVTYASPIHESSLLSSRPSRSSAQTSRALNVVSFEDEDSDELVVDPYEFDSKHRKKGHRKHHRSHTLKIQTPIIDSIMPSLSISSSNIGEINNETQTHKVPSLKIKLPEPVPKTSTSIISPIKNFINCKLKIVQDNFEHYKPAPFSKKTSKVCLSPQNAEVSSSVQEIASVNKPLQDSHADSTSNEGNSSSDNENNYSHCEDRVAFIEKEEDRPISIDSRTMNPKISPKRLCHLGNHEWSSEDSSPKDMQLSKVCSENPKSKVNILIKESECIVSTPPIPESFIPTHILKPTGRKRGRPRLTPLIVPAQNTIVTLKPTSICTPQKKIASPKSEAKVVYPNPDSKGGSPKRELKDMSPKREAKVLPNKIVAKVASPKGVAKVVSPKREAKIVSPKKDSKIVSPKREPKAESPKRETKVVSPKRETLPVKLQDEKNLSLLSNLQSAENKIKKDLLNLRRREMQITESLLALKESPALSLSTIVASPNIKKNDDCTRRSSRLYKTSPSSEMFSKKKDLITSTPVNKISSITSGKQLFQKKQFSNAIPQDTLKKSSTSEQPDYFESLKQQIEMPLYVEKFPSCDKSEVSSTSELSETCKPVNKVTKITTSYQSFSRETPILDAHMAVEGHSQQRTETKTNSSHSLMEKSISDIKSHTGESATSSNVKIESDWPSQSKSGYLIENLIENDEKDTLNKSITTKSTENTTKFSSAALPVAANQEFLSTVGKRKLEEFGFADEKSISPSQTSFPDDGPSLNENEMCKVEQSVSIKEDFDFQKQTSEQMNLTEPSTNSNLSPATVITNISRDNLLTNTNDSASTLKLTSADEKQVYCENSSEPSNSMTNTNDISELHTNCAMDCIPEGVKDAPDSQLHYQEKILERENNQSANIKTPISLKMLSENIISQIKTVKIDEQGVKEDLYVCSKVGNLSKIASDCELMINEQDKTSERSTEQSKALSLESFTADLTTKESEKALVENELTKQNNDGSSQSSFCGEVGNNVPLITTIFEETSNVKPTIFLKNEKNKNVKTDTDKSITNLTVSQKEISSHLQFEHSNFSSIANDQEKSFKRNVKEHLNEDSLIENLSADKIITSNFLQDQVISATTVKDQKIFLEEIVSQTSQDTRPRPIHSPSVSSQEIKSTPLELQNSALAKTDELKSLESSAVQKTFENEKNISSMVNLEDSENILVNSIQMPSKASSEFTCGSVSSILETSTKLYLSSSNDDAEGNSFEEYVKREEVNTIHPPSTEPASESIPEAQQKSNSNILSCHKDDSGSLSEVSSFKDILMEAALAADIDSDYLGDSLCPSSHETEDIVSEKQNTINTSFEDNFSNLNTIDNLGDDKKLQLLSVPEDFTQAKRHLNPIKDSNLDKFIPPPQKNMSIANKDDTIAEGSKTSKIISEKNALVVEIPEATMSAAAKKRSYLEKLSANVYQAKKDSSKGLMEIIFDLDKKASSNQLVRQSSALEVKEEKIYPVEGNLQMEDSSYVGRVKGDVSLLTKSNSESNMEINSELYGSHLHKFSKSSLLLSNECRHNSSKLFHNLVKDDKCKEDKIPDNFENKPLSSKVGTNLSKLMDVGKISAPITTNPISIAEHTKALFVNPLEVKVTGLSEEMNQSLKVVQNTDLASSSQTIAKNFSTEKNIQTTLKDISSATLKAPIETLLKKSVIVSPIKKKPVEEQSKILSVEESLTHNLRGNEDTHKISLDSTKLDENELQLNKVEMSNKYVNISDIIITSPLDKSEVSDTHLTEKIDKDLGRESAIVKYTVKEELSTLETCSAQEISAIVKYTAKEKISTLEGCTAPENPDIVKHTVKESLSLVESCKTTKKTICVDTFSDKENSFIKDKNEILLGLSEEAQIDVSQAQENYNEQLHESVSQNVITKIESSSGSKDPASSPIISNDSSENWNSNNDNVNKCSSVIQSLSKDEKKDIAITELPTCSVQSNSSIKNIDCDSFKGDFGNASLLNSSTCKTTDTNNQKLIINCVEKNLEVDFQTDKSILSINPITDLTNRPDANSFQMHDEVSCSQLTATKEILSSEQSKISNFNKHVSCEPELEKLSPGFKFDSQKKESDLNLSPEKASCKSPLIFDKFNVSDSKNQKLITIDSTIEHNLEVDSKNDTKSLHKNSLPVCFLADITESASISQVEVPTINRTSSPKAIVGQLHNSSKEDKTIQDQCSKTDIGVAINAAHNELTCESFDKPEEDDLKMPLCSSDDKLNLVAHSQSCEALHANFPQVDDHKLITSSPGRLQSSSSIIFEQDPVNISLSPVQKQAINPLFIEHNLEIDSKTGTKNLLKNPPPVCFLTDITKSASISKVEVPTINRTFSPKAIVGQLHDSSKDDKTILDQSSKTDFGVSINAAHDELACESFVKPEDGDLKIQLGSSHDELNLAANSQPCEALLANFPQVDDHKLITSSPGRLQSSSPIIFEQDPVNISLSPVEKQALNPLFIEHNLEIDSKTGTKNLHKNPPPVCFLTDITKSASISKVEVPTINRTFSPKAIVGQLHDSSKDDKTILDQSSKTDFGVSINAAHDELACESFVKPEDEDLKIQLGSSHDELNLAASSQPCEALLANFPQVDDHTPDHHQSSSRIVYEQVPVNISSTPVQKQIINPPFIEHDPMINEETTEEKDVNIQIENSTSMEASKVCDKEESLTTMPYNSSKSKVLKKKGKTTAEADKFNFSVGRILAKLGQKSKNISLLTKKKIAIQLKPIANPEPTHSSALPDVSLIIPKEIKNENYLNSEAKKVISVEEIKQAENENIKSQVPVSQISSLVKESSTAHFMEGCTLDHSSSIKYSVSSILNFQDNVGLCNEAKEDNKCKERTIADLNIPVKIKPDNIRVKNSDKIYCATDSVRNVEESDKIKQDYCVDPKDDTDSVTYGKQNVTSERDYEKVIHKNAKDSNTNAYLECEEKLNASEVGQQNESNLIEEKSLNICIKEIKELKSPLLTNETSKTLHTNIIQSQQKLASSAFDKNIFSCKDSTSDTVTTQETFLSSPTQSKDEIDRFSISETQFDFDLSSIPLPPVHNCSDEELKLASLVVKRDSFHYNSNEEVLGSMKMARKNKIEAVSIKKDTTNGDVKEVDTSPKRVNTRQRSRSRSIEKDVVASAEIERRNLKSRRSSRNSESSELKMDSNNLERLEIIREVTDGSIEGAGPLDGAANSADIPMLDLANVPLPEPKDSVVIKIPTGTLPVVNENTEPKEDKDSTDSKIAEPTVPETKSDPNQANPLEQKDVPEDLKVADTSSAITVPENKDKKPKSLTSNKRSSAEDNNSHAKKKHSRSRSASSSSSDRSSSRRMSSRKSRHSTSRRKSPLSSRYHRKSTRSSRHSSHKADDRSRSRSSDNSLSARKKRDDRKRKEDKEKEDKKLRDSKVEKKDKDDKPTTGSKEKCVDENNMSKNPVEEMSKEDVTVKKTPLKEESSPRKEEKTPDANSSLIKDEISFKKTSVNDLSGDKTNEMDQSDAKTETAKEATLASKDSKDRKSKINSSQDRDSVKRGSSSSKDSKRDSSRENNHRRDSSIVDSKRETSVRDRISFGGRERSGESPLKETKKTEGVKDAKKIVDRCFSTEIEGLNEAEKGDLKSMLKDVLKETDQNEELVPFKSARKVSLNRSISTGEEEKAKPKRRKWGSSAAYKPTLEISSNSLKSLIPDVKPLSPSELTLDYSGESSEEEEGEMEVDAIEKHENVFSEEEKQSIRTKEIMSQSSENLKEESEDEGRPDISPKKKKSDLTETKKRVKNDRSERRDKRDSKRERIVREISPRQRKRRSEEKMERPGPIRKIRVEAGPAPSSKLYIAPAKNPVSNVVIIQNLTRPFTIKALKDMLQRTGRLTENGFWMDRIKSVCLAMFETVDQAEETRVALHGVKWPTTSPKNLIVDFSTEEELRERFSADGSSQVGRAPVEESRKERKKLNGPIREWDLAKMGERSPGEREREKERQRREREEERVREKRREQSPKEERKTKKPHVVKSVDDLFKKTKAQPYIYWLPLSSEQIAEKEALRRKKMAESERMLAEIKEQEKKKREKERELLEKEREKKREKEREREKERMAKRSRSRSRRRSRSRSQRKSPRRSPRRSRRSPSRDSRKSHRRSRSRSRS